MADQELIVDWHEEVALLTLNRPQRRNALSTTQLISLAECFEGLGREGKARCAILRGSGDKAFCAGMDLTTFPEGVPEELLNRIQAKGPLQYALEAIEDCPIPVIAMISGYGLGAGCELSMACDLRVGSENCVIGMPPARLGIVYPPEGLARFVRTVGLAQAKKLFLTARYFPAPEALQMGLLHYVAPDDQLESFTMELARDIVSRAPLALGGMKRSLNILSKYIPPPAEELEEIDALIAKTLASRDVAEALAAFKEKRDPRFKGE